MGGLSATTERSHRLQRPRTVQASPQQDAFRPVWAWQLAVFCGWATRYLAVRNPGPLVRGNADRAQKALRHAGRTRWQNGRGRVSQLRAAPQKRAWKAHAKSSTSTSRTTCSPHRRQISSAVSRCRLETALFHCRVAQHEPLLHEMEGQHRLRRERWRTRSLSGAWAATSSMSDAGGTTRFVSCRGSQLRVCLFARFRPGSVRFMVLRLLSHHEAATRIGDGVLQTFLRSTPIDMRNCAWSLELICMNIWPSRRQSGVCSSAVSHACQSGFGIASCGDCSALTRAGRPARATT